MDLINEPIIDRAKRKHADARDWLTNWRHEVKSGNWRNPDAVRALYTRTSFLPDNRVVFRIKGKKYRLVVRINYRGESFPSDSLARARITAESTQRRYEMHHELMRRGKGLMTRANEGQIIKPIRTEEEHEEALARIDEIFDAEEGTPEDLELEALVEQVKAYEARTVERDFPDPISAIKFRMDQAGLTQRDLIPLIGSRAKVSEVLSGKRDLTMSMARALHEHLGVPADALLKKPGATFGPAPTPNELRRFPWREMVNREWLKDRPSLLDYTENMYRELEQRAGGQGVMTPALLRENGHRRMNAKTNPYALWAWCLRVLGNANEKAPQGDYEPGIVDEAFMRDVALLSTTADGPLNAREHLATHGIALVVEKHLKSTYLDGAVLCLGDGRPVIGLTLRYDRIDNFWFTLMHELAHVGLHLGTSEEKAFFDDLELKGSSRMEMEADQMATNALIPPGDWENSTACEKPTPMAVYELSQKAGVHMAVAAGRVRYEFKNYRLLSQFVGRGEVGRLFEGA